MSCTDTLPLANIVTLGVRDLARMRDFYREIFGGPASCGRYDLHAGPGGRAAGATPSGWPQVMDDDDFAAFELRGIVLALFPVEKLAADGRETPEPGRGGVRFTIGMNVDHPGDVDAIADRMRAAGARITKPPVDAEFFDGRSCYLADPEGNFWEIVWAAPGNPVLDAAHRAAGVPG